MLRVKELMQPIKCELVGGKELYVKRIVYLRLSLSTAAGPVNINDPVECLVVDGDSDEFLLGRDVLAMLGIDVERQLELLALRDDGADQDDTKEDPGIALKHDQEIKDAVERTIKEAVKEGFPVDKVERLRTIMYMYDVWRVALGDDPPARVPPLSLKMKTGVQPYKCKARTYSPQLMAFLDEFNEMLVKLGWVYENPRSRWACPALPVKKPGSDSEFRQTNDYKPVNVHTVPIAGVMPNLHVELKRVKGCRCFGLFGFIKGYWQLPLSEESQEILSYMTHRKIYTPRRVPQGCADAALYFQSTIEQCFASLLYKHLLVWIDDLLLYAEDVDTYLEKLTELLGLADTFGFKLSATKSQVYKREVKWCGKRISGDGVSHDPERIQALKEVPYPSNAGELQQFVCSTNWMRDSIIDYARVVRPLQDKLDQALAKSSKRTKRAASAIPITLDDREKTAFDDVKDSLASAAMLVYPKQDAEMCLLTDASDIGWSVIVTQVTKWNDQVGVEEQKHELLVCMSGTFTGAQKNWSVIEKEAYPIVTACDKLSYLLMRPRGFRMHCDHRNLIHVFAPSVEVKKHVRGKLLRWAMRLMEYRYTIEHIDGAKNVWADMVSRWAAQREPSSVTIKRITRKRARQEASEEPPAERPEYFIRPFSDGTFKWPTLRDIDKAQSEHVTDRSKGMKRSENGLWMEGDRIWIPTQANELLQRLMVIAHCGPQGHRGRDALIEILKRRFSVNNLRRVVDRFLSGCLMCKHVKGGRVVPRPWSQKFRSHKRNEALHWDYLYLGESFGDFEYLLVMKDDATHYVELVPCAKPTSTVTAEAILDWHSRFGVPRIWISDNGSHFKNDVMRQVSRRLNCHQEFTLAYSPWINGSVERVNKDVIQVLSAMCLEHKVDIRDWTYFVPVLQANLNHTPVPSLRNRAPVELFCVLPAASPLDFCLDSRQKKLVDLGKDQAHMDARLDELRESVLMMHKEAKAEQEKQTERNKKNQKVVIKPNFDVGDYVLRSRVDQKHHDKLMVTWIGPYQVVGTDVHSFRVRHLVTGAETDVHPSRLKFYADKYFEETDEIREHVASQGIVLTVAELKEHRWNGSKRDFELLVSWKGLEPIEDSWESLKSLYKDVSGMILKYVATCDDDKLKKRVSKLKEAK
ncbi:hypothetical protein Poli38472_007365 [Pythium oligandrum]|uniref:Reverse transcriptase n=1 Tax=Pythium oligandrum TaxID=41045 RepID=A0A8K1FDA4_PYTOL|nr:hypothetical protein Poli38472_007365 [Pythium oligandrum]|eukprot:TMW59220.1 hypothetical protein Poli38472_007365 [Pythium oligandrum]